jgi:predicted HAD superfamily phosphohydrolase YqeG
MHDIAEYDTFLINVNDTNEVKQLLNLIEKIHQQNSKLIVVTNDFEHLISIFKEKINEINIKEKLFDRTRIILPGLV